MTSTFKRVPHSLICSIAAARNVSHAASSAVFFCDLNEMRELGAGRGFARAVDADDGNDRQARRRLSCNSALFAERLFSISRARDGKKIQPRAALRFVSLFDGGHDLRGHRHAQVGGDERGFEFLERVGGQLGRARDDAFDFVGELGVRFGRPALNLANKSHEFN